MDTTRRCTWFAAVGYSLYSASTLAGYPITPDAYTVSNGVVNAPCPTGATCTNAVSDNGFLQRQVKTSTGTYVQFILTDAGVSGSASAAPYTAARGSLNFTNEDFVRMGNRGNGLASKQAIYSSDFTSATQEDRFSYVTQYLFGWAQTAPDPWVNVKQSIQTVDYGVNPLNPTETFLSSADITSSNTSFSNDQNVKLYQYVGLGGSDAQKFQYSEVSGLYQLTSHPSTGPTPLLPGGTNGGDFTWVLGNKLAAVWVGQELADSYDDIFGYTHYAQLDAQDHPIVETGLASFTSTAPADWQNPPFGPVEAMGVVHSVTPTAVVAPPVVVGDGNPVTGTPASGSTTPLGAPTAYGQWTVASGNITPTYAAGAPAGVTGNGVLQRYVTIGGDQYIQTIVTDANATGDPNAADFSAGALGFQNESFVKVGVGDPAQEGIAAKLHLAEQNLAYKTTTPSTPLPTTGGQVTYTALVNTGWASGSPLAPAVEVHQRTTVPDNLVPQVSSFDQKFDMKVGGNNTNNRDITLASMTGTDTISDTNIPLSLIAGGATSCRIVGGSVNGTNCVVPGTGFVKPIMFETRILTGNYQTGTHTPTDPQLLPAGATNGGNIAWSPGQGIQATWVGGQYSTSDPAGDEVISATSYTNLTTGERTSNVSRTTPQPYVWDTTFGAAPVWTSVSTGY